MDLDDERPRKRRAINACIACRTSKVKCDGKRPACQRCIRNESECQYHTSIKDSTVLRIEHLEDEVAALRAELQSLARDDAQANTRPQTLTSKHATGDNIRSSDPGGTVAPLHGPVDDYGRPSIRLISTRGRARVNPMSSTANSNFVERSLISWQQASFWFRSFFSGSHLFVPIFSETTDTFESVASRSAFLFDAIVSIGCRAEEGFNSSTYHLLQARLREHLTNVLINISDPPTLETVQAIAVMASYSENGFILVAIALRFAQTLGISDAVDQLMAKIPNRLHVVSLEERELYRIARIWHGICNLELFFSLDGGKVPGINLQTSSRKIRALVNHPEKTAVDVRLLSQVELNIIRSNAYNSIVNLHGTSIFPDNEAVLRSTVSDTSVELALWLEEWTAIISSEITYEQSLALLNISIQYEWAVITLHLKALSDSGIENIAIMNEFQRDMVQTAKEAAIRHLRHLLQASSPSPLVSPNLESSLQSTQPHPERPAYLSTFKWTMDYVWAKCAFSVLLVLKLALLLRDPLPDLMNLLRDAHKVLEELKKITVGHIAYFQILQTSIEKCENALREYLTQQTTPADGLENAMDDTGSAENEFQGYAPNEFVFEWDFPGLNLKHMPLAWQDLFIDLDNVF